MTLFGNTFEEDLLKMADMHIGKDGHVHPNDTSRKVFIVDENTGLKFETTEKRCREGRAFDLW